MSVADIVSARQIEVLPAARRSTVATALYSLLLALVSYGLPVVAANWVSSEWVVLIAVVVVVVPTTIFMLFSFEGYLYYWLALALTQNSFAGLWLTHGEAFVSIAVTEMKTVSALTAIILSLPTIWRLLLRIPGLGPLAAVFILVLLLNLRSTDAAAIAYARNFILPIAMLLLVAANTWQLARQTRLLVLRDLVVFVTLLLSVGALLESILGSRAWREFFHIDNIAALGEVSDRTTVFGVELARVGGFIIEPTNAGYVAAGLSLAIVVLLFRENLGGSMALRALLALAVLLLVGAAAKSGLLMLVVAGVGWLYLRTKVGVLWAFILSWLTSFALIATYVVMVKGPSALSNMFSNPLAILGGDSTTYHLAGLISGIQGGLSSPLGHGLGNGGNFGKAQGDVTNDFWITSGGESSWGVLAFQLGLVGLLALLGILVVVARSWGISSAVILCGWAASAMFAEAIFGPQTAGLLMISAALLRVETRLNPVRPA